MQRAAGNPGTAGARFPEESGRLHGAVLFLLLFVAAALRLSELGAESVWYDEAVSIAQSKGSFGAMIAATAADNYPPLHNIILWSVIKTFGASELAVRLPSAIAGWLFCLVIYIVGRELFGRSAALLALAFIATSPFHIYHSQDARMYALFVLLAGCSFLMLTRSMRAPTPANLIGYALVTAAFLYTHFFAFLTLGAQGAFLLYLLAGRQIIARQFWRIGLAQGAAFALFVPWIPAYLTRAHEVEKNFWIETPTVHTLHASMAAFAGSSMLVLPAIALMADGVYRLRGKAGSSPPGERTWAAFLVFWLLALFLIPFFVSRISQPVFLDRYNIPALTPLSLLVGLGAAGLYRASRFSFSVAGLLAAFTIAVQLKIYYFNVKKEDVRQATAFIESRAKARDAVLVLYADRKAILDYYARRGDITVFGAPLNDAAAMKAVLARGGIWVVSVRAPGNDENCEGRRFDVISRTHPLELRKDFHNVGVCYYRSIN